MVSLSGRASWCVLFAKRSSSMLKNAGRFSLQQRQDLSASRTPHSIQLLGQAMPYQMLPANTTAFSQTDSCDYSLQIINKVVQCQSGQTHSNISDEDLTPQTQVSVPGPGPSPSPRSYKEYHKVD